MAQARNSSTDRVGRLSLGLQRCSPFSLTCTQAPKKCQGVWLTFKVHIPEAIDQLATILYCVVSVIRVCGAIQIFANLYNILESFLLDISSSLHSVRCPAGRDRLRFRHKVFCPPKLSFGCNHKHSIAGGMLSNKVLGREFGLLFLNTLLAKDHTSKGLSCHWVLIRGEDEIHNKHRISASYATGFGVQQPPLL